LRTLYRGCNGFTNNDAAVSNIERQRHEIEISDSMAKAKAARFEGALWQTVIPFANLPPRVKFSSEEMALLLSLDYNLFYDVGPYDDVHNSLLDQVELYGVKVLPWNDLALK
jgi:hypothetical protein